MKRLFVTDESSHNAVFQYILGWQPSEGWIVIEEEVKQWGSEEVTILTITVLLDSRYAGRQPMISEEELALRFGKTVSRTIQILRSGHYREDIASVLWVQWQIVVEKTISITLQEQLIQKTGLSRDRIQYDEEQRLSRIRILKSSREQAQIKEAIRLTDELWNRLFQQQLLGKTELEVRGMTIAKAFSLWLEAESFPMIVASGVHSATPHHQTSARPIDVGPLLIDMGRVWQGYCSDSTRTVRVNEEGLIEEVRKWGSDKDRKWGSIYEKFFDILEIVQQAHAVAIQATNVWVSTKELDTLARTVITQAGYGDYFTHSLGHGVGVAVHESPSVSSRSETVLQSGMVITIEPWIYLPGMFGVRWEDIVIL